MTQLPYTSADIVIIGAGISGAVLAERYASMGKKVLVIEKRNHVGGNCYDFYNSDGILVSKYGAHLFHTDFSDVWEYIHNFSDWYPYEHRVLAYVDSLLVPVPVNITTVNMLLHLNIRDEAEMKIWVQEHQRKFPHPKNGKEAALSRVGSTLYEKLFKNYTKKQWNKYPEELDASVLNRIPVRTNWDDRYFSDRYQALPKKGYTKFFETLFNHPNIDVRLNIDFFDIKNSLHNYEKLFYTGPIDQFFNADNKQSLEYRSIHFVSETHAGPFYQEHAVINYPNDEKFTRIVEYKHITGQSHPLTTIVKEYTTDTGEPYYPVPNPINQKKYAFFQKKAEKLHTVFFVGRLANYKYFNMDQAFKNSLDLFYNLEPDYLKKRPHYYFFDEKPDVRIPHNISAVFSQLAASMSGQKEYVQL